MEKKHDMEVFDRINKVRAPAYLKTRIEGRLTAQAQERMPLAWVYSLSAAIAILCVMNLSVLATSSGDEQAQRVGIESLSSALGMTASNQLYND